MFFKGLTDKSYEAALKVYVAFIIIVIIVVYVPWLYYLLGGP